MRMKKQQKQGSRNQSGKWGRQTGKKSRLLGLALSLTVSAASLVPGTARAEAAKQTEETAQAEETLRTDAAVGERTEAGSLMQIPADQYPAVDGSTATLPLSAALYRLMTGCTQKEADEAVVHTKTTTSYIRLIEKEADLLIVADKNSKVDETAQEYGVTLEQKPIALDAFIFMANEANPVTSLTQEQIREIYSGTITNWSEVGGADQEIIPFQRNENAGSQTAMKQIVMQGQEMIAPESLEIATMEGLLKAVASYNNEANAIGYSYYYYSSQMHQTPGLRYMAVDGVEPCNESVQNGTYPYIARYYAVIRSDEPEDSLAHQLYNWLGSRQGQELIADLGYIPVDASVSPEQVHAEEAAKEPLPIGENECLVVQDSDSSVVILDRDGRVIRRFENSILEYSERSGGMQAFVIPAEEAFAMQTQSITENGYRAGAYLISEDRWVIEPGPHSLLQLSENVYATNGMEENGTELIAADRGTVAVCADGVFIRSGDYIYSSGGYLNQDSNSLYNLNGDLLSTFDGNVTAIQGERVLISKWDGTTVCQKPDGSGLWTMGAEYLLAGHDEKTLSWADAASGSGFITDWQLNCLTDDEQIRQGRPELAMCSGVRQEAESGDGSAKLVTMMTEALEMFYYLCDSEYQIQETYAENQILIEHDEDGYGDPWFWYIDETGILRLRNLWSGLELAVEFDGVADYGISILRCGEQYMVGWYDEQWESRSSLFKTDGTPEEIDVDAYRLNRSGSGLVFAVGQRKTDGQPVSCWFMGDGSVRIGSNIMYMSDTLQCVKHGFYLYVEGTDGTLYQRILVKDEERSDLEWTEE